ncbi:MAG: oligosaccharide flippase family protein [Patescibacteria group bacterium]|nr:oligosaccharide flippase family protein [Patescibacteria group bacterium]
MSSVYRQIAKDSAIIMASRLVLKFFSVFSYFMILRALSLKDYGFVSLALSISGPALAISGLGLDDLLLSQGARARGEKRYAEFAPVLGGFIAMRIVILAGITASLFFVRSLLGEQYLEVVNRYLWQAIAWVWIVNIRWIGDGVTQMFEKFKRFSQANILESALRAGMILLLYLLGRLNINTVLWVYILSKGIPTVLVFPALRHLGGWGNLIGKTKSLYSFVKQKGAWETVRMLSGNLLSGLNQWIVAGLLGLEAVAIYNFASSMNSLLAQFSPFRQILYPIVSRMSSQAESASVLARRMSKYAMWLAALMLLGSAVGAPLGVWLLAPKYLNAIPAFYLLAFSQLINAATVSHGPLMYSNNEQKYLLKLSVFGTVSGVTVMPFLTWVFGVYGAILESHLSTLTISWLREKRLRDRHGVTSFVVSDVFKVDDYDKQAIRKIWQAAVFRVKSAL